MANRKGHFEDKISITAQKNSPDIVIHSGCLNKFVRVIN